MDNVNIFDYISKKGNTTMNELQGQFRDSGSQLKENLHILMQTHAIRMDEKGNIFRV